jgi:hypothetical protein
MSEKYDWEDFLRSLRAHLDSVQASLITAYLKRHNLTLPIPLSKSNNGTQSNEHESRPQRLIEDDISVQAELAAQEALRSVYGQNQYQSQQVENGGSYTTNVNTNHLLICHRNTTRAPAAATPAAAASTATTPTAAITATGTAASTATSTATAVTATTSTGSAKYSSTTAAAASVPSSEPKWSVV